VVQVAIILISRYSAAITKGDSKEIDELEHLWVRAFKKAWKVNASLPDVTIWAGLEQGGLGTPKSRAIITSETISLTNQCMCLHDDLWQVTVQDMSQAIAHLGCSTIAEAQAELQWNGEAWQHYPSLFHRFLACTSRGMQREWTAIQNADTPILTDKLMSLMLLSKPATSNEADWREARMWLREMAGMGLHRIEFVMDGTTLILPTKLRSNISARNGRYGVMGLHRYGVTQD